MMGFLMCIVRVHRLPVLLVLVFLLAIPLPFIFDFACRIPLSRFLLPFLLGDSVNPSSVLVTRCWIYQTYSRRLPLFEGVASSWVLLDVLFSWF